MTEVEQIYEYWQSKFYLYKHKKLTEPMVSKISNALNRYRLSDILLAIDNYNEIMQNTRKPEAIYIIFPKQISYYMPDGKEWLKYQENKRRNSEPVKTTGQVRNMKQLGLYTDVRSYVSH